MDKNIKDLDPEKEFWKIKAPYPVEYAELSNGEKIGYMDTKQGKDVCLMIHG